MKGRFNDADVVLPASEQVLRLEPSASRVFAAAGRTPGLDDCIGLTQLLGQVRTFDDAMSAVRDQPVKGSPSSPSESASRGSEAGAGYSSPSASATASFSVSSLPAFHSIPNASPSRWRAVSAALSIKGSA
jgi:hypothetical protein